MSEPVYLFHLTIHGGLVLVKQKKAGDDMGRNEKRAGILSGSGQTLLCHLGLQVEKLALDPSFISVSLAWNCQRKVGI